MFNKFPPLTSVEAEEARLKARFRADLMIPTPFAPDMPEGIRVNVEAALKLTVEIAKHFQNQPSTINGEEEKNKKQIAGKGRKFRCVLRLITKQL
jgi:hypothetical protein